MSYVLILQHKICTKTFFCNYCSKVMINVYVMFVFTLENSPSDTMSNSSSLPTMIEGYGRKRKKRTSIETNIKLTLEKRFHDVSARLNQYLRGFYNVPVLLSQLQNLLCIEEKLVSIVKSKMCFNRWSMNNLLCVCTVND